MIKGLRIIVRPNSPERAQQLRELQDNLLPPIENIILYDLVDYEVEIYIHGQRIDFAEFTLTELMYVFNQTIRAIDAYKRTH